MPNAIKHQLFRLVKTLDKSEKRNFKLYATRSESNANSLFVQLFNVLDRMDEPDDALVQRKLDLSPTQYSNLKRHLYQQLLTSLRLIFIGKELDIELREQIDFGNILYGKGLYLDALRVLERAKSKAVEHDRDLLHLEILEFQKLIESRHVTLSRQEANKMDRLVNESAERSFSVLSTNELFNMNIQIHGRYIERGHARSPEAHEETEDFWREIQTIRVEREVMAVSFHQKINRFQSGMWYHYIRLDFEEALSKAREAVNLFYTNEVMMVKDPDLYMRCLYYAVSMAYLTGSQPEMARYNRRLQRYLADDRIKFNLNSREIGFVYGRLAGINDRLIVQDWQGAATVATKVVKDQSSRRFRINAHRYGLFCYKAAAASFMLGRYDEATDYLFNIINAKTSLLRDDLLINTRLLQALCNFETGQYDLTEYNLTNLGRLLRKSGETARVHTILSSGLRRLLRTVPSERDVVFEELAAEIAVEAEAPFEVKALTYLDSRLWIAQRHRRPSPAQAGAFRR